MANRRQNAQLQLIEKEAESFISSLQETWNREAFKNFLNNGYLSCRTILILYIVYESIRDACNSKPVKLVNKCCRKIYGLPVWCALVGTVIYLYPVVSIWEVVNTFIYAMGILNIVISVIVYVYWKLMLAERIKENPILKFLNDLQK